MHAYFVSFSCALIAAAINAVFGFLLAWVLVKYDFPARKWIDAAVDLPFALPTSVAGLTLATVYSDETIIGKFLESIGIQVGVAGVMVSAWAVSCSTLFVYWMVRVCCRDGMLAGSGHNICLGATVVSWAGPEAPTKGLECMKHQDGLHYLGLECSLALCCCFCNPGPRLVTHSMATC